MSVIFYFNRRYQVPNYQDSSMWLLFRHSLCENLWTSVDNFLKICSFIRLFFFFPHWCVILQFLFLVRVVVQNTTCCSQLSERFSSFLLVITPFLWISFQQSNLAKGIQRSHQEEDMTEHWVLAMYIKAIICRYSLFQNNWINSIFSLRTE